MQIQKKKHTTAKAVLALGAMAVSSQTVSADELIAEAPRIKVDGAGFITEQVREVNVFKYVDETGKELKAPTSERSDKIAGYEIVKESSEITTKNELIGNVDLTTRTLETTITYRKVQEPVMVSEQVREVNVFKYVDEAGKELKTSTSTRLDEITGYEIIGESTKTTTTNELKNNVNLTTHTKETTIKYRKVQEPVMVSEQVREVNVFKYVDEAGKELKTSTSTRLDEITGYEIIGESTKTTTTNELKNNVNLTTHTKETTIKYRKVTSAPIVEAPKVREVNVFKYVDESGKELKASTSTRSDKITGYEIVKESTRTVTETQGDTTTHTNTVTITYRKVVDTNVIDKPVDTTVTDKPTDTTDTDTPVDTTVTDKPVDTTGTDKPADTTGSDKPVDTVTDKPVDTTGTDKPVDTVTDKPVDTTGTDKPVDTVTDKPVDTTGTDKPVDTVTDKPVDTTGTDEPVDTVTDKPVDTVTDKPVDTTGTDKPVDTVTDKPVDTTGTDKPVDTVTDKPVDTVTDKPVDTVTDKPVTTSVTTSVAPQQTKGTTTVTEPIRQNSVNTGVTSTPTTYSNSALAVKTTPVTKAELPQTGDASSILTVIGSFITGLGSLGIFRRKK